MSLFLDPAELARKIQDADAKAGIVYDPTMTHEKQRAMMRELMEAQGIRLEDNIGSHELMRMRYGDDWDEK